MEYIKKKFKKLGSMGLNILGSFLVLEHIYTYGYISLGDFLGHEWFGIIFIILGLFCARGKWQENESRIQYALKKIKAVFKND